MVELEGSGELAGVAVWLSDRQTGTGGDWLEWLCGCLTDRHTSAGDYLEWLCISDTMQECRCALLFNLLTRRVTVYHCITFPYLCIDFTSPATSATFVSCSAVTY